MARSKNNTIFTLVVVAAVCLWMYSSRGWEFFKHIPFLSDNVGRALLVAVAALWAFLRFVWPGKRGGWRKTRTYRFGFMKELHHRIGRRNDDK